MKVKRSEYKSKSEVELPIPIWIKIMYCCNNKNITEICKCVYCYNVQAIKNINELESNGLVTTEVQGRTRIVKLTKDGEEVSNACKILIASLKTSVYANQFLLDLNNFNIRNSRLLREM